MAKDKKVNKFDSIKAKAPTIKPVEQKLFARDIAENFGVSSFDFLIIKRQNDIEDTTPISVSEFKQMYQKMVEGR